MTAKELQIGDWLVTESGTPRMVVQITKHKIGYHRTELPFGACKMSYARLADVAPIPITAEILEKNGWWKDVNDLRYTDESDIWVHTDVEMSIEKFEGRFQCYDVPSMQLNYVHEMQHALRLCGLVEMADNFKV